MRGRGRGRGRVHLARLSHHLRGEGDVLERLVLADARDDVGDRGEGELVQGRAVLARARAELVPADLVRVRIRVRVRVRVRVSPTLTLTLSRA